MTWGQKPLLVYPISVGQIGIFAVFFDTWIAMFDT